MKAQIRKNKKGIEYEYFTYFEFIFWTSVIIACALLSCIYSCISNHITAGFLLLAGYGVVYLIGLECANNHVYLYNKGIYIKSPLKLITCCYISYNDIISIQLVNSLTHYAFSYRIKYINNHHEKTVRATAPSSLKSIKKFEKILAKHNIVVEYMCKICNEE